MASNAEIINANENANASIIAVLKTVSLFEGLGDDEIAAIYALMDARNFAPGQLIIREGEPGDDFHILAAGRAQCVTQDATGQEITLTEYSRGGFFGELSMLTGEPRSARIKALDAVTTLALDRAELLQFLHQHPAAAVNVLIVLSKQLSRTGAMLRNTVSRNVNEVIEEELTRGERITEYLANLSGTLKFLILHVVLILGWLLWNQPWVPGPDFDPFPFGFLGTVMGLEGIFLAILLLVSQNRQESKDRIAEEIHHQINTKAEVEIALVLQRLDDLERSIHYASDEQSQLLRAALQSDAARAGSTPGPGVETPG